MLPSYFQTILDLARCRRNILLVGPAGCGKTTVAELVAKTLGLAFGKVGGSSGLTETHLLGKSNMNLTKGTEKYRPSEFVTRYEKGGVMLVDELDAADQNVLLVLNPALDRSGKLPLVTRLDNPLALKHKDFVCIATANTFGRGQDRIYAGRNQLDGATLSRFQIGTVECYYDAAVERAVCPDDDLRDTIQGIRKRMEEAAIRKVIDTRFLEDAFTMKEHAKWSKDQILTSLFAGWTASEKSKVLASVIPLTLTMTLENTMQYQRDDDLKGHAFVFENIEEVVDLAEKCNPSGAIAQSFNRDFGGPIYFDGWEDVRRMTKATWTDGMNRIQGMAEEIRKSSPPQPVSVRRLRRWSENDGDVDVDRAVRGDDYCFREVHRERRPRTQNIAIMCNIGARYHVTNEQLFWRSAAAIVAIDLLEESGYSCEVWAYRIGEETYTDYKCPQHFAALRVKDAGEAVDIDLLAKATAPWFFRSALWGSYSHAGKVEDGFGKSVELNKERWFGRHCNVDRNLERVWAPFTMNKQDSIEATRKMLESVQLVEGGVS